MLAYSRDGCWGGEGEGLFTLRVGISVSLLQPLIFTFTRIPAQRIMIRERFNNKTDLASLSISLSETPDCCATLGDL